VRVDVRIGDIVHLVVGEPPTCLPAIVTGHGGQEGADLVGFDAWAASENALPPSFGGMFPHGTGVPLDAAGGAVWSYHLREECPRGM